MLWGWEEKWHERSMVAAALEYVEVAARDCQIVVIATLLYITK